MPFPDITARPMARLRLALFATLSFGALALGSSPAWAWCATDFLLLCLAAALLLRQAVWLHALWLWAAGYLLLACMQWIWHLSRLRSATLTELLQLLGLGAAMFLGQMLLPKATAAKHLLPWAWGLSSAVGLEAALQTLTAHQNIYWSRAASYATPVGPYIYHNHYAGFQELLIPLACTWAYKVKGGTRMFWVAWAGVVCVVVSVLLSASRAGLIILCAEILVWMWIVNRRRRQRVFRGLLILGVLGLAASQLPVMQRFRHLDLIHQDRWWVARDCGRIFREHWVVGVGLGAFGSVYPAYQSFDDGKVWDQAHNEYAQALAESGCLGALMVVGFVLSLGGMAYQAWKPDRSKTTAGMMIALSAFLLHSTVDFEFHNFVNSAIFFVLCGAIAARWRSARAGSSMRGAEHERLERTIAGAAASLE